MRVLELPLSAVMKNIQSIKVGEKLVYVDWRTYNVGVVNDRHIANMILVDSDIIFCEFSA